jgi:hypothetical protein
LGSEAHAECREVVAQSEGDELPLVREVGIGGDVSHANGCPEHDEEVGSSGPGEVIPRIEVLHLMSARANRRGPHSQVLKCHVAERNDSHGSMLSAAVGGGLLGLKA